MRRVFNLFLLAWISAFLSFCSPSLIISRKARQLDDLKKQISFLINDPSLANAHIGLYIESLKDGKVLYSKNPFKLMVPASNMKLFTTAAALVKLGPDFTFKTKVAYRGTIKDSVLQGDLIIIGSGDPSISGKFYDGQRSAIFNHWADSLKVRGIRKITGQVLGDESYFKDPKLGDGWNWDDEPFWYSAKISALALNNNCVDLAIWPDSVAGKPAHFKMFPLYEKMTVENKALTISGPLESDLNVYRLHGKNKIIIEGLVNVDSDTIWESISVENPIDFFIYELKKVLNQNGIQIASNTVFSTFRKNIGNDTLKTLFVHQSPPLSELIKVVNKPSHNFYAEQLLKTLGAVFKGEGSFQAGAQVVREFLNSIGVAKAHFVNVDGSGLSRKNFVAPIATATLLRYMYFHPYFKYYLASLPIAGIDGTIKKRMRGTIAQGTVHAKTGYVRHMRALSGYTNLEGGNPILFVMMFNNYSVPTPKVNLIQDKIAILLTAYAQRQ